MSEKYSIDIRQADNLKVVNSNYSNLPARIKKINSDLATLGINLREYWVENDNIIDHAYDELFFQQPENQHLRETHYMPEYFGHRQSQKVAMPYEQKDFMHFLSMPKARVGKARAYHTKTNMGNDTTDDCISATYIASEEGGAHISEFAVTIICKNEKPDRKYKDFSIKLDMCVGGKAWLPLFRYDSAGTVHRNFADDNGTPYKKLDQLPEVDPPHIHMFSTAMQLFGSNLDNDQQAYNDKVPYMVVDENGNKRELMFSMSENNPVFNALLESMAIRSGYKGNISEYTASFSQIMHELTIQRNGEKKTGREPDPKYFKNCLGFIGAMAGCNLAELFNEKVDENFHFEVPNEHNPKEMAASVITDREPSVADAVIDELGGMD